MTSPSISAPSTKPLRVVHVLSAMNRAGIETWLMHVLRRQDRQQIEFELLLLSSQLSEYEPELRELGIVIRRCPPPEQLSAFLPCLYRTLRHGRYDVVHSHVHHFSGLVLLVASLAGIRGRLAHSHIDTLAVDQSASVARQMYLRVMSGLIGRFASGGFAVSEASAVSLYGERWRSERALGHPRWRMLPLGLNIEDYTQPTNWQETRRTLGISADALVLGHVGRLESQKNHAFLLEVFAEVHKRLNGARLLLVGAGELLEQLQARAQQLNVKDAVIFAGSRGDVATLLQAMDVFVWPSVYEGLGLALIEAQMTGLPCVAADHLPAEAHLPGANLTTLPLSSGAADWAAAVLAASQQTRRFPAAHQYDLRQSMAQFAEAYEHYRR